MKKLLIFVLSLPFLALAILWFLVGAAFCVMAFPIWGTMCTIATLRGQNGGWEIFIIIPLMGLDMYFEITGFCPDLHQTIKDL